MAQQYQKTGKPPGRPRKYLEAQQCLGVRVAESLYQRLATVAAEQQTTITHVTTRALTHFLESPQPPALAVLEDGLLAMGEAASDLEARCSACPSCKPHITTTLNAAWPKLTAALDALNPEQGA
jgi:hypothetical protein